MEHKKKVPTLFDTCPLHLDMCSAGYRILSHYWPAWLPLFYSENHHIGCLVLLLPLHALSHSDADQNLDLVPHLHNKHLHVHNVLWFSDWLNQNAKILQNYITLYFRSKFWIHLSFAIWIKKKETHLWPKKIIKRFVSPGTLHQVKCCHTDSFNCRIERGKLKFFNFS